MTKIKKKSVPQTNKNNKTKPENLVKKEYLESYDELKKNIQKSQQAWRNILPVQLKKILENNRQSIVKDDEFRIEM